MNKLLYGVAYYDEYMPYDRLDTDVEMMKKAGINVVRIAESTWSTCEPQEGVFDFSHVERVLDAMEAADISVIIGTPTYAVPTWLVKLCPDVLATTVKGRGIYGARQIMDITNPTYLYHAEQVIRELLKRTAHRKCVTGFQIDNETKHYDTAGANVQTQFVEYLKDKFDNDLDAMNYEFGLDYWSNRINAWEDFPDVRGTINGSLGAEFEKFQRTLVDDFFKWQADIINEYRREDQFITHNFDFEWRGYSYGIQPGANHIHSAKYVTKAGVDIYHPTQDELTGAEIAFGGDEARSLKNDNYLVLETEAQGFPGWTPYKGQLRLQAFSHIASGANCVEYWHWHSIHNSYETYWKGLLSHDFKENDTYKEACTIGRDFARLGSHLVNLKKKNDVAILVSNEALTALKWFGIEETAGRNKGIEYNDVLRFIYDTLYRMNVECDIIWPETGDLSQYKVIVAPALYAAEDDLLERLNQYVYEGGCLLATFKTGFANENIKVSHDLQPHIINECLGITYDQFTFPKNVSLQGSLVEAIDNPEVRIFMELLSTNGAEVLASYNHYNWGEYAAITKNAFGKGYGYYLGCMTSEEMLERLFIEIFNQTDVPMISERFPIIIRKGINDFGKEVRFIFNYSGEQQHVNHDLTIEAWGFRIYEDEECIL